MPVRAQHHGMKARGLARPRLADPCPIAVSAARRPASALPRPAACRAPPHWAGRSPAAASGPIEHADQGLQHIADDRIAAGRSDRQQEAPRKTMVGAIDERGFCPARRRWRPASLWRPPGTNEKSVIPWLRRKGRHALRAERALDGRSSKRASPQASTTMKTAGPGPPAGQVPPRSGAGRGPAEFGYRLARVDQRCAPGEIVRVQQPSTGTATKRSSAA